MKKIAFLCAVVLLFACVAGAGDHGVSMQQAVEKTMQFNPAIQSVREALSAADYGIHASKSAFGPSLSTQYGYTRIDEKPQSMGQTLGTVDNWELRFNIHQPLFTGFYLLSSYEKSLLQKEQVVSQINNIELQLSQTVRNTFFQLLEARENVRSAEDSLARLKSQLRVSAAFYEVGLRPKFDMLQAEVDVAAAEQDLVIAKNSVDTLVARLNTLLGEDVNAEVNYLGSLEYFPVSLDLDACIEQALRDRPDLRIAQQTVLLAQKDEVLAAVPYYPQVSADFNYIREGDEPMVRGSDEGHDPSQWTAQVGLKWTFFEWGKTYFEQRQANKNVSRLTYEYENLVNEAIYEVKKNYLQIKEAEKRIIAAKQGLVAAKEGYRMAVARYEAQVGTNTDVLDAQSKQTLSEASLNSALAAYGQAVVRLYGSMGVKNPAL